LRLLEQAGSILELVQQASDRDVEKMLQVVREEKVLAQAQGTGVRERDLPLLGQNMELWGETLHVIVIVVAEVFCIIRYRFFMLTGVGIRR
jgi:hypothetical protein